MTYLQMVNNVLKRLRERSVSSVTENEYSELVGILINDAKREVQDAYGWSGLRTTLTAVTSNGIVSYELNGSQSRVDVLDVWNDDLDVFLEYKYPAWMTKTLLSSNPDTGSPTFYSFNGVSSDKDTLVDLYPVPDAAYNIRFNCVVREEDFETDSETTQIPVQPILMLAYAKAIEERGEDAGVNSGSAYMTAQRSLSDAISLDASKHPEELIWRGV